MWNRIERSFSAKLSFYVISSIILLSTISFLIFRYHANRSLERNAHEKIQNMAERADLRVTALLNSVEKIPENMQWIITDYINIPDSLFNITRKIVQNNTEIFGCAIAFEPYYFKSKGHYFAPYSYMKGDSVVTTQVGSDQYNYFQKNWYRLAREQGISRWSKPYHDVGDDHVITSSYSVPFRDKNKNIIGVFAVDLSTDWLTDLVNSIRPYPNSYAIMIDKFGNYIVHKKEQNMTNKNIFATAENMKDTTATWLVHQMIQGKSGKVILDDNGIKSYVFYAPITATDWYMCIVFPYEEVFRQLNNFNSIVLLSFILVLIMIYIVCSTTVKTVTKPLHTFAAYARSIANGNFDTPLPAIRSKDEMKELHDSFQYMQQQLKIYIDTLQKATAAKEKIDSELRIAHRIQMGMLPKTFPAFPDRQEFDLYAVLTPAKQVGGDLYDFFIVDDDLYFAIGDVSGKGVPASLLMSGTISLLRSVSARHTSPRAITTILNNNIAENSDPGMFVTFFIGMLNLCTGEMHYCNAGHIPPILTSPTLEVTSLDIASSLPLGILKDYEYIEQHYTFAPGSGILLYTDGVTDAENPQKQFYTKERLINTIRCNNSLTPKEFIKILMKDIHVHVQNADQADDLTMLTIVYGDVWNDRKTSKKN